MLFLAEVVAISVSRFACRCWVVANLNRDCLRTRFFDLEDLSSLGVFGLEPCGSPDVVLEWFGGGFVCRIVFGPLDALLW